MAVPSLPQPRKVTGRGDGEGGDAGHGLWWGGWEGLLCEIGEGDVCRLWSLRRALRIGVARELWNNNIDAVGD